MADSPKLTPYAADILQDPRVLTCAWEKARDWYRNETRPEPEYTEWTLNPDQHLRKLAQDIVSGAYIPGRFPLVPYPKKGGEIRHYAEPSVRDQVAFILFGVLLAPLFEVRFENWSFGNRWFREMSLKTDSPDSEPKWQAGYYKLSDKNLSVPYSRSYGLFRRVAHWRAKQMLGGRLGAKEDEWAEEVEDVGLKESDYAAALLPYHKVKFAKPGRLKREKAIFFSRLDIAKAYPSISREEFARRARNLIVQAPPSPQEVISAFPSNSVWRRLEEERDRASAVSLLEYWLRMLKGVQFHDGIVGDSWLATLKEDATSREKAQHDRLLVASKSGAFGLPTGLAVSGLLFNIALSDFDRAMQAQLQKDGVFDGIILRFVDDIILIGCTKRSLTKLLSKVDDYFVGTSEKLGLDISWRKARPEKLWEAMKVHQNLPVGKLLAKNLKECVNYWEEAALTSKDLKEFVTDLVEQLSELGSETVDDLLGEHGEVRLRQLHDLVRVRRDDSEVKDESRLSFAATRLARHPLPFWLKYHQESTEADPGLKLALVEIRRSISMAIEQIPWRFRIWQAVIAAAVRLVDDDGKRSPEDIRRSMRWLESVIKPLALGGAWEEAFPGAPLSDKSQKHRDALAVSFLRTCFWNAWARTVRALDFANPNELLSDELYSKWDTSHWAWHIIPERRLPEVFSALADMNRWVKILYPQGTAAIANYPWEQQALRVAILAAATWRDVIPEANFKIPPRLTQIDLPGSLIPKHLRAGLLAEDKSVKRGSSLALLKLSQAFARHSDETIVATSEELSSHSNRADVFLALDSLGLVEKLSPKALAKLMTSLKKPIAALPRNWLPVYYAQLRSRCIAHNLESDTLSEMAERLFPGWKRSSGRADIYSILWGAQDRPAPAPATSPAVGLPPGIVLIMLANSLESKRKPDARVYSWALDEGKTDFLWWARGSQFTHKHPPTPSCAEDTDTLIHPTSYSSMPPHPAFLLSESHGWANALLALTALSGREYFMDALWAHGHEPFDVRQRYSWRTEVLAPIELWRLIELELESKDSSEHIVTLLRFIFRNVRIIPDNSQSLRAHLTSLFQVVRADVDLASGRFSESPMAASVEIPAQGAAPKSEKLIARIAQLTEHPAWQSEVATMHFPKLKQRTVLLMLSQLLDSLPEPRELPEKDGRPDILIGPEIFLPYSKKLLQMLKHSVKRRKLAMLVGLYWQEVPQGVRPSEYLKSKQRVRYFVNEALLLVPIMHADERRPYVVREYKIPKPIPAAVEYALARSLTNISVPMGGARWEILPGSRWYRFLHPMWGAFSVAICSDLLDPIPWARMRGRFLHLFIISNNTDVDLYQSITWSRAYECYVNLIAVNHGEHGGSFSWTPKHRHHKEVAVIRGQNLNVVVDVELETQKLLAKQRLGWEEEVARLSENWPNGVRSDGPRENWKTPPRDLP